MNDPTVAFVEEALSTSSTKTIYVIQAKANVQRPSRPAISMIRFEARAPDFRRTPIAIGDEIVCDDQTRCSVRFILGGGLIVPAGGSVRIVVERSAEMTGYLLARHIKQTFLRTSGAVLQIAAGVWGGGALMAGGRVIGTVTLEAYAEVAALEANIINAVVVADRLGPKRPPQYFGMAVMGIKD